MLDISGSASVIGCIYSRVQSIDHGEPVSSSELEALIIDYVNHIQEDQFWHSVLTSYSSSEIADKICLMLQAESDDSVSDACHFVRDLVCLAPEVGVCQFFKSNFFGSDIVRQFECLLRSSSFRKRDTAAITLGRTGCQESVAIMKNALAESFDSNPLFLLRLAREIHWLDGEQFLEWFMGCVAKSTCALSRWAAVDVLNTFNAIPEDPDWDTKYQAITELCSDEDSRVSDCADQGRYELSESVAGN